MVWACGKNGWVPYTQKGAEGRSQWRTGTRETERGSSGWMVWRCLGQHKNDWRLLANARKIGMESPGAYVTKWVSRGHFCLALCSFGPPSRALVVTTWKGVVVQLHGINCKKGATTEYRSSGVQYMGYGVYLEDCVLSDWTWLPLIGGGRKSWCIIFFILKMQVNTICTFAHCWKPS